MAGVLPVFASLTAARNDAEIARLAAIREAVRFGARTMDAEADERLRQYLLARQEIAAGDRLVLATLRGRARARQRFVVGVLLVVVGVTLPWRSTRWGYVPDVDRARPETETETEGGMVPADLPRCRERRRRSRRPFSLALARRSAPEKDTPGGDDIECLRSRSGKTRSIRPVYRVGFPDR